MTILDRALRMGEAKQFKRYAKRVDAINAWEPELELLDDEELRGHADRLRERARDGESLDDLLQETFAVVREVSRRRMGMRHFDVQMIGGMVLHGGAIAEMRTGEGKTLTGTLAVALNALAGKGVHVVTVNDYLARRDAEWMKPIYDGLGLTVGVLQNMQPYEEKRDAYAADITYGTNSEFGFDYLRDNMATSLEEKVQHGGRVGEDGRPIGMHQYAIVDEVDNILIDEARTPLIISGAPEQAADLYDRFAKLAPQLVPGKAPEGMDPKRTKKGFVADYDFEFDEKHKTVSVTEQGVAKAEKFLGIDHLYKAENGPLVNHLNQALKAESLYKRDVDYAVVDGEVKIIDEFTGRILDGRRWSEGLHQAVEAKEGVRVQEENQTLATVTLQNYFRMYDKLAGMTGTALTEANEFMKIYKLQVVEIPTNRPMVRADRNDQIFKTRDGKWAAVARRDRRAPRGGPARARRHDLGRGLRAAVGDAAQARHPAHGAQRQARVRRARGRDHRRGRPRRRGHDRHQHGRPRRRHQARRQRGAPHAARAGQARPQARRPGLRGALRPGAPEPRGASVEEGREKVMEAGGLFICGTERHESRRIDNQLRGRAGRQGDPGESRFFLSAEDDLVRLFAGDRIYRILDRLGPTSEDGKEEPIEAKMLTKQIEGAQRKVEEQNFLIRKRVLEYDDVMNQQREIVYKYRDEVLEGRDMGPVAREEIEGVIGQLVDQYTPGDYIEEWDLDELWVQLDQIFHVDFGPDELDTRGGRPRGAQAAARRGRAEALRRARGRARRGAHARAGALPAAADHRPALARAPLRHGLPARGDPPARVRPDRADRRLQERGVHALPGPDAHDLVRLRAHGLQRRGRDRGRERRPPAAARAGQPPAVAGVLGRHRRGPADVLASESGEAVEEPVAVQQRRVDANEQLGRNDPCWCGSGKKFKKCHGAGV